MNDEKLNKLREDSIAAIEESLEALYKKLPSLPDNFSEIEGEMDSDDILGHPEGPDLLYSFPETYRWVESEVLEAGYDSMSVFWFNTPFIPSRRVEEVKDSQLEYVIEIEHEFGKVAVYKQKGEWRFVCEFVPESGNPAVSSEENRIEGRAGLNLLMRVRLRLNILVSSYSG